ncbi:Hypothetical protein D9617_29g007180 [Elsinoe fawcettii]|nr:Hypothetical protein D9617_29g007180 [Elsinoe fawcettii]
MQPPEKVNLLYGGNISICLPNPFRRISETINAESYQEVFLDPENTTSVIVELLDRVSDEQLAEFEGGGNGDQVNDMSPMMFHLHNLTSEHGDQAYSEPFEVKRIDNNIGAKYKTWIASVATQLPDPPDSIEKTDPDYIMVFMALIRYTFADEPERDTDIVISVPVKFFKGAYDPEEFAPMEGKTDHERAAYGDVVLERIIETFQVVDEKLFGAQEEEDSGDGD